MTLSTRFARLAGIEHPIVHEGAGPFKTAAALPEPGGLGTVSMPVMAVDPEEGARALREHMEETASPPRKPFAMNVPVARAGDGSLLPVSEAHIRKVNRVARCSRR